jgi:ATP-dependent DNA helicase RecG
MYPGDDILTEVSKGGDYTSKFVPETYADAIDPAEVARLRIYVRKSDGSDFDRLGDEELLISLGLGARGSTGLFRPNVAGLLLVGKVTALERVLPQAEIGFISLPSDTKPDREEFIRAPLLAALERVTALLQPYNTSVTVRTGLFEIAIPRLPELVLREALLNALSHRDYISTGSVYVRLFPDRTEISNPGGFLEGITPENIIHHEPYPRNRTLAEALQKIGLVNRAGLGVDRMYEVLLENGKEPPIYVAKPNSVVLKIFHEINESFAKFCAEAERSGTTYDLDEILILKNLCRHTEIDSATVAAICQRSLPEVREKLSRMVKRNLLDKRGQKRGQHFYLARKVCDQIGEKVEYTRDRGIDEIRHPEMVKSYLRDHGTIRNKDCQELCGIDRYHAIKLLNRMKQMGIIELKGNRGRGAYYVLASTVSSPSDSDKEGS